MTVSNCVLYMQVVVFVVGGGNYIEYQNLVDYIKVNFVLLLQCGFFMCVK